MTLSAKKVTQKPLLRLPYISLLLSPVYLSPRSHTKGPCREKKHEGEEKDRKVTLNNTHPHGMGKRE